MDRPVWRQHRDRQLLVQHEDLHEDLHDQEEHQDASTDATETDAIMTALRLKGEKDEVSALPYWLDSSCEGEFH